MAPPAGTLRVGRYFLALFVLVAILYTIVFVGSRHTPKLGIDLVGGTEVVFTAKTQNGKTPSHDSMEQARNILSERVNGTGVTQSTVEIQGNDQLVVSIPGQDATDIQKLGAAAVLNFRGVVAPAAPIACTPKGAASASGSSSAAADSGAANSSGGSGASSSPSPSDSGAAANVRPLGKASAKASGTATKTGAGSSSSPSTSPSASPSTSPTPATSSTAAQQAPACSASSVKKAAQAGKFSVPLTDTAYNKLSSADQQLLTAGLSDYDCAAAQTERDEPKTYYVACGDAAGTGQPYAYLLGPVIVAGKQIDTASAVAPNAQQGQVAWTVRLSLKGSGQSAWANYTGAHNVNGSQDAPSPTTCGQSGTPCADYVGFTLDGVVISSPVNLNAINGGDTEITGDFTASSAKDLANKLKFGALPVNFSASTATTVSATLGTSQLKAGLLAGGIGLILVVIYSLLYYRALGLVTIASLLVSGILTYGAIVMLATQIGFTLSLAGIAGFIVAVGITADSFVVFFERLKDEVHEGRSVRVAVPRAWVRARRTILSADTVSFLAAAVLYYFTTDEVRGFAFTLGLSTILDLIVVFLFTHPMVSLLSRSQTFGSARFTGLDALRGAPAPEEPVRRQRPARSGARADGSAAAEEPSKYAGVATLEKPSRPVVEPDIEPDIETDIEPDIEPPAEPAIEPSPRPAPADEVDEDGVDEQPETDEPRRRTAPEPGSAAERAAARRARLRGQQSDEKGKD